MKWQWASTLLLIVISTSASAQTVGMPVPHERGSHVLTLAEAIAQGWSGRAGD